MVSGSLSNQRPFLGKKHEWSVRPHSNYCVYEERYRFPSFGRFYCPDQLPPALDVSKHIIRWVAIAFGPSSPSWLRAPHPSTELILALIAPPPSPTSPSPTAPRLSIAKLITHRHVGIAFFRFPVVNYAHIPLCFLIAFRRHSAPTLHHCFHYALAPTYIRRRCRCVNHQPSFSSLQSLSDVHCIIRAQRTNITRTRSASATPTLVTFTSNTANQLRL